MSKLLAIETSGSSCSVAVALNGDVYGLTDETPRSHAQKLLPMVDKLLGDHKLELADLDGIAFTNGPGSFTGLRIGFGAVQGLAMGLDVPVWGVSTLGVMAEKAVRLYQIDSGVLIVSLDARMGEVYWSGFEIANSTIARCLFTDSASSPDSVSRVVAKVPVASLGSGQSILAEAGLCGQQINQRDFEADASVVASLAVSAFDAGEFVAIDDAGLNYIRNEVSWKKHQKIRPSTSSGAGER